MNHLILASLTLAIGLTPLAAAESATPPTIRIEKAWLRAAPRGAQVLGGYATVTNLGTAPDRIVGAEIAIASKAEVHSMTMKDGVMRMRRLDEGLPVAAGATVTLSPGGYHLMFFKPMRQITEGQTLRGAILLEKAGAVPVTFAVGGMGATSPPADPMTGERPGLDMKAH